MFIGPKFAQTYQSVKGLKYRLDELGGDWIANPELMFATLPSNMEQLSGVIDEDVSRSYQTLKRIRVVNLHSKEVVLLRTWFCR